jgi:hypothetical protein
VGDGAFMASYTGNREGTNEAALKALNAKGAVEANGTDVTKSREWPKNGWALGGKLRRISPNLRAAGYEVDPDRKEVRGRRGAGRWCWGSVEWCHRWPVGGRPPQIAHRCQRSPRHDACVNYKWTT